LTPHEAVVAEALSWKGTPYVLGQHLKGADGCGCDCATFLVEAGLVAGGALTRQEADDLYREVGVYSSDWFLHTSAQKYFLRIMKAARLVLETRCYASVKAEPGTIVLTKCVQSENWNHGGIVIKWPQIMHCVVPHVCQVDASKSPMWARAEIAIFDPTHY
jgi:cell wall-associated NlpC family hydrolase